MTAFGKVLRNTEPTIVEKIIAMVQRPKRFKPKPALPAKQDTNSRINELAHAEANRIESVFQARGLDDVYIDEMTASPIAGYIRYHVNKPVSVAANKITALQSDIAIELTNGRTDDDDVKVNIRLPSLVIEVEYPFERTPLAWSLAPISKLQPGECIVGRDYSGKIAKPVTLDLSSNEVSNIMVAALPGSGKSQAAVQMVASAAANTSPKEIKFILLDPKCSKELKLLGNLRHAEFIEEHEKCVQAIHEVREEIERRKHNDDRRTIVLVIDELAEFVSKSKEHAELIPVLRSIARMGRSFGVKVIAATQYPMAEATDSELRAMLDARLGGHVGSETQSRVCMDIPGVGCETLPKRGAFYYKDGNSKVTRINTHYLPYEDLFNVVDETNERWLDDRSFFFPLQMAKVAPEVEAAEEPTNLDEATPEQAKKVLSKWKADEVVDLDTKKIKYGMGTKVIKHVFDDNPKTTGRRVQAWKLSLVQQIVQMSQHGV